MGAETVEYPSDASETLKTVKATRINSSDSSTLLFLVMAFLMLYIYCAPLP